MAFELVLSVVRPMRRIINLSLVSAWALLLAMGLCVLPVSAFAQPEAVEPVESPPKVPVSVAREISQADEVIITEEGERKTFEYKVNGQLRVIRVIPAVGPEYYLYPEDQSLEAGIDQSDSLLVRWKILEF